MPKKKPGFSFETHQLVGHELHDMREHLQALRVEIQKTYGKSAVAARLTHVAIVAIDDLRSYLDDLVTAENPDRQDGEVNRCYYPGAP
jgi:hypothetical protein